MAAMDSFRRSTTASDDESMLAAQARALAKISELRRRQAFVAKRRTYSHGLARFNRKEVNRCYVGLLFF